jgi:tetratricopeptide (TPR) repeat protein
MKYSFIVLFFSLALLSCGESKPTKALPKDLDSLLVLYPDSVELIIKHGNKMLKNYQYDKAMADGAKAFRLDSTSFDARLLFADALNNRPNRSVSDVSAAQRHFKYLLKKEPKNTHLLVGIASTYSQQMDFDRSFQYINQALKINPRFRDAYVMKGSNYLFLNKPELAKSSYETAVQQDPSFYEAYLMLGSIYQSENNKICIEYYKTAAQLKPKSTDVLFSLAYAQQVFNQPEEALKNYRKMIQLDTAYYQALNQIGVIKQHNFKQIDSAIYYYNSALTTEPRFVEAWHNLGTCYEEKGDITRAMQSYAKALKYNPEFSLSRERADKLKYAR